MAFVEFLPSCLFLVILILAVTAGHWAVNAGITHQATHWDIVAAVAASAAWALFNDTQAAPILSLLLLGAAFNMGCALSSLSKKSRS